MTATLPIDVVSDVVCPWCFIGKRRLEKAIALKPEIPVEVRFHPYFLNPWVPREGISREEYLDHQVRFGRALQYQRQAGRRAAPPAKASPTRRDKIKRQPNTLDCHRLILWAGDIGNAARMKQRLMELYFTEGGDLTDAEVLVQAAADCGLDAARVRALLASDQDVARVEREAQFRQGGRHRRRALLHLRRHDRRAAARSRPSTSRRRSSAPRRNSPTARRRSRRTGPHTLATGHATCDFAKAAARSSQDCARRDPRTEDAQRRCAASRGCRRARLRRRVQAPRSAERPVPTSAVVALASEIACGGESRPSASPIITAIAAQSVSGTQSPARPTSR